MGRECLRATEVCVPKEHFAVRTTVHACCISDHGVHSVRQGRRGRAPSLVQLSPVAAAPYERNRSIRPYNA